MNHICAELKETFKNQLAELVSLITKAEQNGEKMTICAEDEIISVFVLLHKNTWSKVSQVLLV